MSEQIKAGDLVWVKGHKCGCRISDEFRPGCIHTVLSIHNGICCNICGWDSDEPAARLKGEWGLALSCLRKIPPLSELESKEKAVTA